ncbi:MAG: rhodanese-like domain-containing protein [Proteobacteria bacterium]|nr:rhodanese-like domain-containing protein [Pseudomonadota bacterium]MDA1355647.1 rhodanese-like domain-containing protein [Pseudomonadota bacterium]
MSIITNNNIAPGETVGVDRDSVRRAARERLASGVSYAGDVTPGEAWQVLADDADAVLVDVRTDAEWNFVGVPELGSLDKKPLLISWQRFPDMSQNQEFASELARAGVASSAAVLFLCRSGVRSASAAEHCAAEGFTNCYNIIEGFEGVPDADKHRGKISGWKMRALPWVQG